MKTSVRVVAFAAILTIAVVLLLYSIKVPSLEPRPCSGCLSVAGGFQQVSVCDLTHKHLLSNAVRVKGRFYNDAAQLYLRDGGCTIAVGLTREKRGCTGAWRKLQMITGVGTWYDGDAAVTVIGSTGKVSEPNYFAGEEGLTILCLEEVNTPPSSRDRMRFLIHRLTPGARSW